MARLARIGEASHDDIDGVMRVMDDAFDPRHGEAWTGDQCRATMALPGYRWLIASSEGQAVGFLLARTVADESEMMLLAVTTRYRGLGIGRALVETWLGECRSDGVARAYLEVRDGNGAIEFYRAVGFAEVGRRKAYYSGANHARSDAISMTFRLD
jgi:ribosomal-protein-alanine N-acetyltransferase